MTIYNNDCSKCALFVGWQSCLAFVDKIPEDIWTGKTQHLKSNTEEPPFRKYKTRPVIKNDAEYKYFVDTLEGMHGADDIKSKHQIKLLKKIISEYDDKKR